MRGSEAIDDLNLLGPFCGRVSRAAFEDTVKLMRQPVSELDLHFEQRPSVLLAAGPHI
jgi:hypothetical protein